MMFAFSRDGAVPGNRWWRRVSRHRVPVYAVFAIGVLSGLLMVPAIWNYLVGYAAGTAIAVIGLYIAFILPVFLRLRLGDKFEHGAWSLGRHYKWIDTLQSVWVGDRHRPLLPAAVLRRAAMVAALLLVADELHPSLVCRDRPVLRRLVGALRSEVVQGPGPDGHGGGAGEDRGAGRVPAPCRHDSRGHLAVRVNGEGRQNAPPLAVLGPV